MSNPNSQVSGSSSFSLSLLSEPPDIRKWFSSYTYQSPALDTNEDFCISHGVDEEVHEEKGLYVEDSEDEDEEKCEDLRKIRKVHPLGIRDRNNGKRLIICRCAEEDGKHGCPPAVEVPAYRDSLSLPSEPPDIGNWFSSYAYESPELDSADFDVSLSRGYNCGNSEKVEKGKEEHLKQLTIMKVKDEQPYCMEKFRNDHAVGARSIGAESNKSYSAAQEDRSVRDILSSKNNFCPEVFSEKRIQGIAPGNCNIIPEKSVSCLRIQAEAIMPIVHEEQQTIKESYPRSPAKAPYRKECCEICEDETGNKFIAPENESGWILLNHKSRGANCKSIKKHEVCSGNRLALMKEKASPRINDENSPEQMNPRECKYDRIIKPVYSSEGRKDAAVTREVLKETTNFHCSFALESAGKWRCPQKSKPNTGPPLKQLRLERWVTKSCR